jgi:hypothetical protein
LGSALSGNFNDDYQFPIKDGFMTEIKEKVPILKKGLTGWVSPNPVWFAGFRYNGDPSYAFDGGVTMGNQLLNYLGAMGPTFNPFNSYPVEVRFNAVAPQLAYRMRRAGGVGTAYVIQASNSYVNVPFTVWDMRTTPRQMTVAWRDQNNNALYDPLVNNDNTELPFLYDRSYNAAGHQWFYENEPGHVPAEWSNVATVGAQADIIYGVSLGVLAGHVLSESNGTLKIVPEMHLTTNDKFVFTTPGVQSSPALALQDIDLINVFPNPYYGSNQLETGPYQHFVRFTHLPKRALFRFFNLGGILFRTIIKDDASQFLDWDLQNEHHLPVASGIYIVQIQLPDLGKTKIIKLAIIQQQQYIDYY